MPRHQASPSARRRLRRSALVASILVALGLAGYVAACALAPIPPPVSELSVEAESTVTAGDSAVQELVDGQGAPTAVGWVSSRTEEVSETWANSDDATPIASISKIVTALVALEAQPFGPGEDGRTHVWSAEDAARQAEYLALDGIVFPIPVGTEVTERQMLTLALLPSANDFAAAYAVSVFGSVDAYVAAVDEWAQEHGLDSLTIVEPTGLDGRNSAAPADLVRIGGLALANPTIAEITGMRSAQLPWGIGEVRNTNPLLGSLRGTVGLKTGFSGAAGYALLAAQEDALDGAPEVAEEAEPRRVVGIVVTLDRPTPEARAQQTREVLLALDGLEQQVELVAEGEAIGVATTVDGARIPLVAAESASAVLLPGETAARQAELRRLAAGPAGRSAGTIAVSTPHGDSTVAVVSAVEIVEPELWWRLTHPGLLFFS